jgi:acyl carrier protein
MEIESCLLSCRALGKGVEFRMFSEMGAIAEKAGVHELRVLFRNTARNMPAFQFLSLLGKPDSEKDSLLTYKFRTDFLKKVNFREFRARMAAPVVDAGNQAQEPKSISSMSRDPGQQDVISDIALSAVNADDIHRRIRGKGMTSARSGKEIVPPSTPNEKIVMGIWEEIFNTKSISIHDDFFKLGGDSLKAVLVLTKLQNIFQIELPMHILFEDALTVHELSKTLATYQLDSFGMDHIDEEMKDLENMSDEDVERLLEKELETNSL